MDCIDIIIRLGFSDAKYLLVWMQENMRHISDKVSSEERYQTRHAPSLVALHAVLEKVLSRNARMHTIPSELTDLLHKIVRALGYPYDLPSSVKDEQQKETLFVEAIEWLVDGCVAAVFDANQSDGLLVEGDEQADDDHVDDEAANAEGMEVESRYEEPQNDIEIDMACAYNHASLR